MASALSAASVLGAQDLVNVTAHLDAVSLKAGGRAPVAVLWLMPLHGRQVATTIPAVAHRYTLLQKNKMFSPHLLVVPVGSVISFPNADPFFHNVFSLFDGKRFDLGLYETGSTKDVVFSREGVSYIFCNIHPEMSAVVVSLATPYFAGDDAHGAFHLHGVPPGEYALHVWVEGEEQKTLDQMTRSVAIGKGNADLGELTVPIAPRPAAPHTNKFGEKYDKRESSPY